MTTTETPRTDAIAHYCRVGIPITGIDENDILSVYVPIINARELERELAESKAEVERLNKELAAWDYGTRAKREQERAEKAEAELSMWRDGGIMHENHSNEIDELRAELERLKSDKTHLITQCANLLEELSEIKETYASIVQQPHFDEREVHCSCVPALRAEVERLKKVIESL